MTSYHRQFNNLLTILLIGFGLYIMLMPWLPNLALWWDRLRDNSDGYVYRSQLAEGKANDGALKDPPEDNRLVIPSINLDEPIIEGSNLGVIGAGGTWRLPNNGSPAEGGNTVIVGHRFSYSEPATFYHLDKLKTGERFALWWNQQEYVYEIFSSRVVPATEISVEGPSSEPIVTLYTCTPIWTAVNRLVVQARLLTAEEI
jgi:LPXTG-site transpeptidase (sortase) family protein